MEKHAKPPVVDEPTATDLHDEQRRIVAARRAAKRAQPKQAHGKDLLTSYMEQLGHIPLYTSAQELGRAEQMAKHEVQAWRQLLCHPRALGVVLAESDGLPEPLLQELHGLRESYRRAAARGFCRRLPHSARRAACVEAAARTLRQVDLDKARLERVLGRLRREVWSRRIMPPHAAYRLTHADLTALEQERGAALRIRNDFVRANLRLVVAVARTFQQYKVAFIDLIQEGNVGLVKAVHRFDHQRGFRFSTYAHWWIRQSIERAIVNKGRQVRLPVHVMDARRHIGRASRRLTQTLGRAPSAAEIGTELTMPAHKVEQMQRSVVEEPISLDEPGNGSDTRKILELLRDEQAPAVDEALIRENTHAHVRELLHLLNPIEKDIIRRRFGLGTDHDQTLEEIGQLYKLSRERVRQIQAQGLMKMRRMCERRQIG